MRISDVGDSPTDARSKLSACSIIVIDSAVATRERWSERLRLARCTLLSLELGCTEQTAMCTRSASAAEGMIRLRENGVGRVDVDVLPKANPAHLQIFVAIAEAAQAVACRHANPWLMARLVLGRRLVVA